MTVTPCLSQYELSILLDIYEAPSRAMAGSMLYKRYPAVMDKMVNEGWLVATGTLLTIDVHGERKKVVWRAEEGAYQYHSAFLGWTTVRSQYLRRYSVNMKMFFPWIRKLFLINQASRSAMLFDGILGRLGTTLINGHYVMIYVCCRLRDVTISSTVSRILSQEKSQFPCLVVSGKQASIPLVLPSNMVAVTLDSLLDRSARYCKVDTDTIDFVLKNNHLLSINSKHEVRFSNDYKVVFWGNKKYQMTKMQASIIKALHEAEGRLHKTQLQKQIGTNEDLHRIMRNRVKGQWVTHPLWDTLIVKQGEGYYGFSDDVCIKNQEQMFD